jgi:hypothetical protein
VGDVRTAIPIRTNRPVATADATLIGRSWHEPDRSAHPLSVHR